LAQVNDSGHQTQRDPAENMRESHRILQENTGYCLDFFRWISINFLCFPAVTGRKSSEKIRKFSGRNTASTKSPELPETGSFRTELFDLGVGVDVTGCASV
jgi:hypothetical protein